MGRKLFSLAYWAEKLPSSDRVVITQSQWLITLVSVWTVVALFVVVLRVSPVVFSFRFNPYALFSAVALVSNIVAFILVVRIRTRSEGLSWFSFHLFSLIMWAGSELFIRLSANPEAAVFWSASRSLGAYFMPVTFYMFGLSYTGHKWSRYPLVFVPLMVTTLVLIFFDFRTSLFNQYNPLAVQSLPWGYVPPAGEYYIIMISWVLFACVASFLMFWRLYSEATDRRLRRQMGLFMVAILIPLVGGGLTDGIMPAMGISNALPMAVLFTSAMGVIISVGILRYRFFAFDPAIVATTILTTMNEAVIGLDSNLRIMYANPGAERLLGCSSKDMLQTSFKSLLIQRWSLSEVRKALFGNLDDNGLSHFDSVDLKRANGDPLTVKLSVSQIMDGDVEEGYLVSMTDISKIAQATSIIEHTVAERTREVQEAKAMLVTSINSLKMGFVIVDARPEVVRVNTVAHGLFCKGNHMAGECTDITIDKLTSYIGDSVELTAEVRQCLLRQLPHELKGITFADRDWRIYLSPMVVSRKSIGCAVVLQDVTEEHLLQRSRDEFFSIASHELRTPLTSIKGNSALIQQYYQDILKDKTLREMVNDIHESSDRLIQIVNDFLDVSRLEQKRIEFKLEVLSVSKIIEEVVYGMGAIVRQKGLYIRLSAEIRRLDTLPHIVADKNRLKQILFNLLGNAVKFTEKGGIKIGAEVSHHTVRITVADTGPGIPPQDREMLFRKFQQASNNSLTRDTSHGTGLGLYISRLLAEGMGGSLELDHSALGKGSVFALTLPVATEARVRLLSDETEAPSA